MTIALWIAVVSMLVLLAGLQMVGVRALAGMGVQSSPLVIALRVANVLAALAIVAFAFWKWVS
ncbi:MAG: hypothetical protein RBS78_04045 [Coriobacteriia bacterium]|nr:hypothetical protein [Coriobacteriia bacterium]